MTTEQFYQKFNNLKETANQLIDERAAMLLQSGAIDLESWEDDFRLPKIVLSSCLEDAAEQFTPFTSDDRQELQNLRNF